MFCKQVCLLCAGTGGKKENILQFCFFFFLKQLPKVSLHELWYAKEKGKFLDAAITCQFIICLFLGALWAPEQSTCDLHSILESTQHRADRVGLLLWHTNLTCLDGNEQGKLSCFMLCVNWKEGRMWVLLL